MTADTDDHESVAERRSSKKSDGKDKIVEPREVDVLCGRGGMSNHHPGNEWYRRLIRSNRPLYRACPKHTKLLVSKAIVQAVEQQGGRFLEKSRKTGFWHIVTYKRAVDKTSQGLRERDREDENVGRGGQKRQNQSQGDNAGQYDDYDDDHYEHNEVPESFSGRSNATPNLSDLAEVAIAHANRSMGLPAKSPNHMSARKPFPDQTAHEQPAMNRMKREVDEQPLQSQQQQQQQQVLPPAQKRTRYNSYMDGQQKEDDEMLAPLPPTLEVRQSSMFRLLQHTRLLPCGEQSMWGDQLQQRQSVPAAPAANDDTLDIPKNLPTRLKNATTLNNNRFRQQKVSFDTGNSNQFNPANNGMVQPNDPQQSDNGRLTQQQQQQFLTQSPQRMSAANFANALNFFAEENGGGGAAAFGGMFAEPQDSFATNRFDREGNVRGNANAQGDGHSHAPPTLTRLTSQVSDWLTSFWPLPHQQQQQQNQQQQLQQQQYLRMDDNGHSNSMMQQIPAQYNQQQAAFVAQFEQQNQQQVSGRQQNFSLSQSNPAAPNMNSVDTFRRLSYEHYGSAESNQTKQQQQQTNRRFSENDAKPPVRMFRPGEAPQITTVPPLINKVEISTVPPPAISRKESNGRSKRKGGPKVPTLPYDGRNDNNNSESGQYSDRTNNRESGHLNGFASYGGPRDNDDDLPLGTAAPTELEHSVSTTLLKLASTPSKLFAGLSSFLLGGKSATVDMGGGSGNDAGLLLEPNDVALDNNPNDANSNNLQLPSPTIMGTAGISGGSAASSSKRSLLDDYEESPMEARLRTVAWNR